MKRKKMRPLPATSSKARTKKAQRNLWAILILAMLLLGAGYLLLSPSTQETATTATDALPPGTGLNEPAISRARPLDDDTSKDSMSADVPTEPIDESIPKAGQARNPKTILNAPLPATDSLAKEEIDRLEDERHRLADQEKIAAEQVAMHEQLTDMKAEQIALLEQQIAQLEADKALKNDHQ